MRGKDKETRAAAIRGLFLAKRVRIVKGPWASALAEELMNFPSGQHDDQVDALGLIGRRFPVLSSGTAQRSEAEKSSAVPTRILQRPDGGYEIASGLNEMFEDREKRLARTRHRI